MAAVVKQGEIVEQGSHGELIQTPNGAYATLVRLQASTHSHPELQQPIVEQLQHSADPEVLRQVISSQVRAFLRGQVMSKRFGLKDVAASQVAPGFLSQTVVNRREGDNNNNLQVFQPMLGTY